MHSDVKHEFILDALATFLAESVRPQLKDPKLSFQVLVAEALLAGLRLERATEGAHLQQESLRLANLLGADADVGALREWIETRTRTLTAEVPHASPARFAELVMHTRETLREDILANNPRFSFAEDL